MKKLSVEIANTRSTRAKGLMNRKSLGEDDGMLFKFPCAERLRFWMQSTYIPLDIAFLDDDGEIFQISEMYPMNTRMVTSKRPCKYALEVNQGWFMKNDVGVGDTIGGLEISDKSYRTAQAQFGVQPDPMADPMSDPMGQVLDPMAEQPEEQQQPNPRVEVTLDDRAKVRYAEQHNYALQLIYQSKNSGKTLPPRKVIPVPGEGYPIGVSEGGEYFTAFDSSPTINGGEWEILGNQIKRFLFSHIIALEVIEEFVE